MEVEDAKKYLLGSLPFRFTTAGAVAGELLAAERYGGDPREGVWRIRERNDLPGGALQAGMILYLPAGAGGA